MTPSPPLPRNLDHLRNGHTCWFYGTAPSTQPCRGTVVGRGRDAATGLMTLTIAPDDTSLVATEVRGGVIRRTVNAIFPDLDTLNAHHDFIDKATPDEVASWTKSVIQLSAMIGGRDE